MNRGKLIDFYYRSIFYQRFDGYNMYIEKAQRNVVANLPRAVIITKLRKKNWSPTYWLFFILNLDIIIFHVF